MRMESPDEERDTAAPPPGNAPFDTAVWRVVGDPLAPATAPGPLSGLSVAVKDLFAVAGHAVGAGVPAWLSEQRPSLETAPAVAALLGAGAHVAGIARTDEFAYSLAGENPHYGTPPNPAAPGCVSGGSTSGPASAVALRQADIGLGTDTAGSIRVPASYQGLVGLRTTHGAVSADGVLPLAPLFDTVGWVTRDVRTSASVAAVLLSATDPAAPVRRALRAPTAEAMADDDVRAAFDAALATPPVADALPPAEEVDLPAGLLERWFTAFRTVQAWQAWQAHGRWLTAHPGAVGADVARRFSAASEVSDAEAASARSVVADAREQLGHWLAGGVLLTPTASGPAPRRGAPAERTGAARAATLRMTCLAGLAGGPALSLPLLRSADGRPAGLSVLAPAGADRGLLALGALLEGGP